MIPNNTIAIVVRGGLVHSVSLVNWQSDHPNLEVIDWDNIDAGDKPYPATNEVIKELDNCDRGQSNIVTGIY